MSNINRKYGFTIVELLIVIVVIAILAAISVVAYTGVQQRAQASALADGFKKIEKGLRLLAAERGESVWWSDQDPFLYVSCTPNPDCSSGNPTIAGIMDAVPSLKNYLQKEPLVSGISGSYKYDNDGDTRDVSGCTSISRGVNIYYSTISGELAQKVDTMIDDGDLNCGKVVFNAGTQLFYNISGNQNL